MTVKTVSAWLKRFGLHLAAAVGATGIFVAAAAVGANQTRQAAPVAITTSADPGSSPAPTLVTPRPQRTPRLPVRRPVAPAAEPAPAAENVRPERSLAGTIVDVLPDGLIIKGVGGRDWRVTPAPGALIRLNGRAARLDALHTGDTVVILGQAQIRAGPAGTGFLAHAITARRK